VFYSEYGIQVEGYISRRDFTRNTRNEQRTFVNGRCVEALAIYRGIREGYGPMLEKGRYPVAILFITINPGEVDVNVHPAKREVRFRHEYELTAAVRSAIAKAL
jgi:DNA mismatch repair protein MutL